ncbi:MAG: hypothetical protein K8R69_01795, partial [Deltaproteobacteria bacterium]|nr:hypothetical protein [Deltaproteobacteria bacterium]
MVERGGLNFVEGLNLSTTPKISESEATAIAKQSVEGKSPLMNNAAKSSIGSQSLPLLNRSSASLTVQENKIEPVAEPIPGEELELTTKSLTFNLDQSAGSLVKMGNPDLGKLKMISTELVV